jgi:hypothetical protein
MGKHRLGASEGSQWGGPDLITGTVPPGEPERADQVVEVAGED